MHAQIRTGMKGTNYVKKLLKQLGHEPSRVSKPHHQIEVGNAKIWIFTERRNTNNIALEEYSDYPMHWGWFNNLYHCRQDLRPAFIFWVTLNEDKKDGSKLIRVIEVESLLKFIKVEGKRFPAKEVFLSSYDIQKNKTIVRIVPVHELRNAGVMTTEWKYSAKKRKWIKEEHKVFEAPNTALLKCMEKGA